MEYSLKDKLAAGLSYGEIAREIGLTRQRVHQIAQAQGLKSIAMASRREAKANIRKGVYDSEVWQWVKEQLGDGFELVEKNKPTRFLPYFKGAPISLKYLMRANSEYINFHCRKGAWVVIVAKNQWLIFEPTTKPYRCFAVDPTKNRRPTRNIPFAIKVL